MISQAKNVFDRITTGFEAALETTGADGVVTSVAKFYPGGLSALLERLRSAGHGEVVDSWIGAGPNAELPADALAGILPPETATAIAWDLGVPQERLAVALAQFLPLAVDRESPAGELRDQPIFDAEEILKARTAASQAAQ